MFTATDLLRAALRDLFTPWWQVRRLRHELDVVYRHANRLCAERDAALAELADRERELAEHTESIAWVARELEAYQRQEYEGRN